MAQEYRHLQCPTCSQKLRISVESKDFGRKIVVTCPCGQKIGANIPIPATASPKETPNEMFDVDRLKELLNLFGRMGNPTRY